MNSIDRLAVIAARTHCPACSAPTLDLRLRCDLGAGPCLTTAQCESCGTTYVIDPASAHDTSASDPCNQCGSTLSTLKLQCDVASHHCVEIEVCSSCRTVRTSAG